MKALQVRKDATESPPTHMQLMVLAAGAVLRGFSLRLSIASVPQLLNELEQRAGLSPAGADSLTASPYLCFALGAMAGPPLVRALGPERALCVALTSMAAGTLTRAAGPTAALLSGTLIAAAGVAIANVVLPILIAQRFPTRTGLLIGSYVAALGVGAAMAGSMTVPLTQQLGWQGALAIWAIPAVLPIPALLLSSTRPTRGDGTPPAAARTRLVGDPVALQLTLFFALQAAIVFSGLSWLPSILRSDGYSAEASGLLLALYTLGGTPVSLALPGIAARLRDQRLLAFGAASAEAVSMSALILFPAAAPASVALFAIAQGSSFSLALTLIAMRSHGRRGIAQLSGMVQSIGYALAAAGPLSLGLLHSAAHNWTAPLAVLAALCVPMAVAGIAAGHADQDSDDTD